MREKTGVRGSRSEKKDTQSKTYKRKGDRRSSTLQNKQTQINL